MSFDWKNTNWFTPRDSRPPFPAQRLLVGVTGSVGAALVVPGLLWIRQVLGIPEVKVVMSAAARQFVSRTTAATMSGGATYVEWNDAAPYEAPHIALTEWADVFLVMPATANILAKAAGGIADDLLSTCILAAECPVVFAPDMNPGMWAKPATQRNVAQLRADGYTVITPTDQGAPITGGRTGPGSMPDVPTIMNAVADALSAPPTESATSVDSR